jgi:hypothetical protein
MQTPARTRDPSKRMSRLHSSSFSNPFKRRGSNAAFVTPSESDFVCQQLSDIGFPETELVIQDDPAYVKPSNQWPPRKPLPRSTTESSLSRPLSKMPDSPTGRRRQALDEPVSLSRRPSRIPTPSRLSPAKSPGKADPISMSQSHVHSRRQHSHGQPPSSFKPPTAAAKVHLSGTTSDLAASRHSRTVSGRSEPHRLSSYDVIVHQLLKPTDSGAHERTGGLPLGPSPTKGEHHRQSIVLQPPVLRSPVRAAASRCLSGSPVKQRLKVSQLSGRSQLFLTTVVTSTSFTTHRRFSSSRFDPELRSVDSHT